MSWRFTLEKETDLVTLEAGGQNNRVDEDHARREDNELDE